MTSVLLILAGLALVLITAIVLTWQNKSLLDSSRELCKVNKDLCDLNIELVTAHSKGITHLYRLMEIVAMPCSPLREKLFETALRAGPDGEEPNIHQAIEEFNYENYTRIREHYSEELEAETDPDKIEQLKKFLVELDNTHMLVQTLSPDSSKEYVQSVFQELNASKQRMIEEFGKDIEDDLEDM